MAGTRTHIFVHRDTIAEIRGHVNNNHKIRAIKLLRAEGKIREDGKLRSPGLREAKHAIDAVIDPTLLSTAEAVIAPAWRVNMLKISGPDNMEIEVDLETLQMHFLTQLHSIGVEQTDHLLTLVKFIQEWQGDA